MSMLDVLPPSVRAWGKTLLTVGGAFAIYLGLTFLVTWVTRSPVLGATIANMAALAVALFYRWRSTGTPLAPAASPRAMSMTFWVAAMLGLAACWLAGQTAAMWVLNEIGDPAYESRGDVTAAAPVALLLLTGLFLAPIGEEALLRGTVYPALRKHWPPLAAAFVTAAVFSLLHGNLVQIVLTLPLGVLLAFVYEACQRLWPVIIMHVVFNIAAAVVPVGVVERIAHPPMIAAALLAAIVSLFALSPGRYASEQAES